MGILTIAMTIGTVCLFGLLWFLFIRLKAREKECERLSQESKELEKRVREAEECFHSLGETIEREFRDLRVRENEHLVRKEGVREHIVRHTKEMEKLVRETRETERSIREMILQECQDRETREKKHAEQQRVSQRLVREERERKGLLEEMVWLLQTNLDNKKETERRLKRINESARLESPNKTWAERLRELESKIDPSMGQKGTSSIDYIIASSAPYNRGGSDSAQLSRR